jgi:hypothetical protein
MSAQWRWLCRWRLRSGWAVGFEALLLRALLLTSLAGWHVRAGEIEVGAAIALRARELAEPDTSGEPRRERRGRR